MYSVIYYHSARFIGNPSRCRLNSGTSVSVRFRLRVARPSDEPAMSYGNDQLREPPLACLRSAATTFYLDEYKTKLGRGRAMDITLSTSKSISSKHAVIEIGQDGKTAILRDLNSLNGTFVNNTRVHNSTCKLKSNDRIRFGCDVVSYLFQFRNDMQEYSPNRGEKGAKRTPQNRGERAGKRNEYGESLDLGNDPRASTIVCAPRQGGAGAPAKTRSQLTDLAGAATTATQETTGVCLRTPCCVPCHTPGKMASVWESGRQSLTI